jgi:DNA-binding XRE family transcriptional regulator
MASIVDPARTAQGRPGRWPGEHDNWASIRPIAESRDVEIGLECLGRTVRRMRLACGLSQRRLANLAGFNQSTISRLERGQLRFLRLVRLAAILGVLDDPRLGAPPRQNRWT